MGQMLLKETEMDKQVQDSIVCSFLWNGTTKDSLILMDYLYLTHQKKKLKGLMENISIQVVIEHWQNEVDGLKNDGDALNEFYRQFPRTDRARF